jgi:hypothetical protein
MRGMRDFIIQTRAHARNALLYTGKPTHMLEMHNCLQAKLCTSINDAFMVIVSPSATYGPTPNLI